ncbi:unnamed protein product, partial [Prorocentrum cordatum]
AVEDKADCVSDSSVFSAQRREQSHPNFYIAPALIPIDAPFACESECLGLAAVPTLPRGRSCRRLKRELEEKGGPVYQELVHLGFGPTGPLLPAVGSTAARLRAAAPNVAGACEEARDSGLASDAVKASHERSSDGLAGDGGDMAGDALLGLPRAFPLHLRSGRKPVVVEVVVGVVAAARHDRARARFVRAIATMPNIIAQVLGVDLAEAEKRLTSQPPQWGESFGRGQSSGDCVTSGGDVEPPTVKRLRTRACKLNSLRFDEAPRLHVRCEPSCWNLRMSLVAPLDNAAALQPMTGRAAAPERDLGDWARDFSGDGPSARVFDVGNPGEFSGSFMLAFGAHFYQGRDLALPGGELATESPPRWSEARQVVKVSVAGVRGPKISCAPVRAIAGFAALRSRPGCSGWVDWG